MNNIRDEIRKLIGEMDLEKLILAPKVSHFFREIEDIFLNFEKENLNEEVK